MLGRRREDPRPPIEVIGDEPVGETTARVTVGSEPGRRRGVLIAAVVALVAIVGTGLAIGGDEEPEEARERTTTTRDRTSRTSRRSTTSTAPVVTAPFGPQLPVQTGAALLVRPVGGRPWVHLDLDTGTRTEVPVEDDAGSWLVGVRGGVAQMHQRAARYVPLPHGDPVDLGPADMVLGAADPSHVWVFDDQIDDTGVPLGGSSTARLVRLPDGADVAGPIDVPAGSVMGATTRGLILVVGGRVYLVEPDGEVTELAVGAVYGTGDRYVVISSCDDRARCSTALLDVESGRTRRLDGLPPVRFGATVTASEGRLAVLTYGPSRARLFLGDVDGGPLVEAPHAQSWGPVPAWLPQGQGLVLVDGPTADVRRLVRVGRSVEEHTVDALADLRSEQVVVIPP